MVWEKHEIDKLKEIMKTTDNTSRIVQKFQLYKYKPANTIRFRIYKIRTLKESGSMNICLKCGKSFHTQGDLYCEDCR